MLFVCLFVTLLHLFSIVIMTHTKADSARATARAVVPDGAIPPEEALVSPGMAWTMTHKAPKICDTDESASFPFRAWPWKCHHKFRNSSSGLPTSQTTQQGKARSKRKTIIAVP